MPLREALETARRAYVEAALARSGGNVTKAAKDSGMNRQHLHTLMSRYGLCSSMTNGNRGNWHGLEG